MTEQMERQRLSQQLREVSEQHAHADRMVAAASDDVQRATRLLRQAEITLSRATAHREDLRVEIDALRRDMFARHTCTALPREQAP